MESDETDAEPLTPKDMTPEQKLAALPQQSVDLSPRQVIELQVTALGDNDKPFEDAGIYTAFNFASPANKRATGPIERFVAMVKNPIYRNMLDFEKAVFGPLEQTDGRAMQIVALYQRTEQGLEPAVYGFTISKQAEGPQEGMWMTDSVIRMKPEVLEEIDPQRPGLRCDRLAQCLSGGLYSAWRVRHRYAMPTATLASFSALKIKPLSNIES